jgi:membrane protein implicated in regulation of membrane protease activity
MPPGRTPQGQHEVWRQVIAGVCLLAPGGAVLWVPIYAAATPRVVGVPYFYVYQVAWVLLTPLLMLIAYVLLRRRPGGREPS